MVKKQILALVFLAFSCACTKKSGAPKNIFRYPIESDPPTLDWSLVHDHVSFEVLHSLQDGLTQHDGNLNVVPALASRWEISQDGKTYTFYLRDDAKWSDGVPVKAEHFVTGWRRLLDPKHAAEYAYFLFDVENAQEYNSGQVTDPSLIGIKALDEKRVQIRLKYPAGYFLHIPTFAITAPQRDDVIQAHPKDFTEPQHLRTTGPYRLIEWKHDSKLTFEPNPYYYGKKPAIEKIEFLVVKEDSTALNLYERGELEVAMRIPALDLDRVKRWADYRSSPVLRGYYYGFNTNLKPFDNVLVRKAFAHAIDRKELVALLKGGQLPAKAWVPRGMFGYDNNVGIDYNPSLAKSFLAKAGFPNGKNFPRVTLMYDSTELNKLVAERLQFAWKNVLNIPDIELTTQEWKVYLDTLSHNTPALWRMGWGADYPDPHNFLDLFTSKSGNNHTHWRNPRYDSLILAGAKNMNPTERIEIYKKAQQILLEEDAAIIPLFQQSVDMVVKPYVQNFVVDPLENPKIKEAQVVPPSDKKRHAKLQTP